MFQSTPAFSGEGTRQARGKLDKKTVSIHPRLFRRGNIKIGKKSLWVESVSIHPRLFRRGNTYTYAYVGRETGFQSTPAFSGEGTNYYELKAIRNRVSIHPRLFRRGNARGSQRPPEAASFNPPPPFQARELVRFFGHRVLHLFQSTPAFSGEGTLSPSRPRRKEQVSIHPRLFRRGNYAGHHLHGVCVVSIHPRLFRRGNMGAPTCRTTYTGFNPPPPFQARERRWEST